MVWSWGADGNVMKLNAKTSGMGSAACVARSVGGRVCAGLAAMVFLAGGVQAEKTARADSPLLHRLPCDDRLRSVGPDH